MSKRKIQITGILGGRAASRFRAGQDQFESSCGIDPDLTIGSDITASGVATPSIYSKFSGSEVNAPVIAVITNPKNLLIYVVLSNGKLISYTRTLGSETLVGTVAGSNAGGAAYYNNYIYIFGTGNTLAFDGQTANFTVGETVTGGTSGATGVIVSQVDAGATGTLVLKNITGTFQDNELITSAGGSATANGVVTGATDVARYGPLSNSPTLVNAWWGGLSGVSPLTDTTYPLVRLGEMPNHWGFVHSDNSLYFLDFANGAGMVHRIHTKKSTFEGDTNDTVVPSAYNVLDLPIGFYPTSIASYGTSVAITAVQTVSYEMNQGPAALFLWNPTNTDTFDQQIMLPDPMASALIIREGFLHVFTGSLQGGIRISTYSGGDTTKEIAFIEDGIPPMPGGVDIYGTRLLFGTYCMAPVETSCVYGVGSRTSGVQDIQNIIAVGSQLSSQTQMTYAIKIVSQQLSKESNPQIIVMAADTTAGYGIYKKATGGANVNAILNFPPIVVGASFQIVKMRIPLGAAADSGTSIIPTITYDDSATTVLNAISHSNYPSAKKVIYRSQEMPTRGENHFKLSLSHPPNATTATPIIFPIEIELDVNDDEKNV